MNRPSKTAESGARLDKWLWAARFYKTRAIARQAIEGGKVRCEGIRAKPGKTVEIGMTIRLQQGDWERPVPPKSNGGKSENSGKNRKFSSTSGYIRNIRLLFACALMRVGGVPNHGHWASQKIFHEKLRTVATSLLTFSCKTQFNST